MLTKQLETYLIELLKKIVIDNDFTILVINSGLDYIHLLKECKPQYYIPDICGIHHIL
ncbi:MAG: transposase [Clostridiaceae bacterium]|nr:transposase [Clostridiaceae bacterium]